MNFNKLKQELIIGTRGSKLALIQTQKVVDMLQNLKGISVSVRVINTEGDRKQDISLRGSGGTGLFVREIERALVDGEIDLAVHSLKDLPVEEAKGLTLAAFLKRDDPREALVANQLRNLREAPVGTVIGSSSLRRVFQLQRLNPGCEFRDIRGNVDTRVRKMESGQYDGIILAMAGLKRLGLAPKAVQIFTPEECLPAPGQGTIAVQIREGDFGKPGLFADITATLNDQPTETAVTAERELLKLLGGGCRCPVGALGEVNGIELHLAGMVADSHGEQILYHSGTGATEKPEILAKDLADCFKGKGIIDWN